MKANEPNDAEFRECAECDNHATEEIRFFHSSILICDECWERLTGSPLAEY
jgi:hypothetical protein